LVVINQVCHLITQVTEEYDGTSWTNSNSINTARTALAGAGTQTSALAFGGYTTAVTGATEEYDGTSWTSNPTSMSTARTELSGCGTTQAALGFGGYFPPAATAATEEWTGAGAPTTKTITVS
jgi:hypothetical protein